jgi:hypothetical protein
MTVAILLRGCQKRTCIFMAGAELWMCPCSFCAAGTALQTVQYLGMSQLATLHSALPILPSTLSTFTLRKSHNTLYTLHFTLHTPHSTLYTLHSELYPLHCTFHTVHCTLYPLHFPLHTSHSTLYTLHSTLYASHFTL